MGRMTDKQFKARLAEITKQELAKPERWHYVSFADDERGGFLGVVVIKGHGVTDCISKCHRLGINPGGQVLCVPIPDDGSVIMPDPDDCNKLLNKADVLRIWPDAKSQREWEEEKANG